MKNYPNGGFPELFELIEDYAGGPEDRQAMALKVIGGAYLPEMEAGCMRDAKQIVDGILEQHGYFVPHGKSGGLHPQSVYAVLNVARYSGKEEDIRWGASRLFRIMEALGKKAKSGEGYLKYAADATLLSTGLAQLSSAAQAFRARFISSTN